MMNYRNPVYTEFGNIDCEVEHPEFGWIPFTANPNDCEEHGRNIFHKIVQDGTAALYVPNIDLMMDAARTRRDMLLVASDWTQLPDVPQVIKDAWAPYRQLLRDVPQQTGFPQDIVWPTAPE